MSKKSRLTVCAGSAWLLGACSLVVDTKPYMTERTVTPSTEGERDAGDARDGSAGDAQQVPDGGGSDGDMRAPDELPDPGPDAQAASQDPDAGKQDKPAPRTRFVELVSGDMSAVVISRAGHPLLFVHGDFEEKDDLGIVRCHDASCDSFDSAAWEVPGNGGVHPHAMLDRDGRAILAYQQEGWGEAKFLRCSDDECSQREVWFFEQDWQGAGSGAYSAITLGKRGFPIVAYYARGAEDLRAAICNKPSCCDEGTYACPESKDRPPHVFTVAGAGSSVGTYGSVAVGRDGFPIFAYYDATHTALAFTHCKDELCQASESRLLDGESGGDVGAHTAMAIAGDGLPIVFYQDLSAQTLKVAKCNDERCSAPDVRTVDSIAGVGSYASVAMPSDGRAVVAYHDEKQRDLKVLKCNDTACSAPVLGIVDGFGTEVGEWTSITLDARELPVISYRDLDRNKIKLAMCGSPDCGVSPSSP